ncbi:HK97 gp10 family phage protein [Nostoc sp. UHCC 0251]|uniref:HK97 gp10 family phage protein n=1 Tax=Nostoc sp. UHCC 0251 TaxID=3110240 RepID=UPI002B202E57|nr:HK97 gp10 family phage protein [Nostoc sp. UHCC 0251]MEA5625311.1 HK97 gp10 family phage protein [Nostoc sp. UHCC 0251]
MFSYNIKTNGPLFKQGNDVKDLIQEALEDTASWGQNRLKDRSPVRTGALKAGWYVSLTKSSIRIDNPVPYTKYVEKKVEMVYMTAPEMESRLLGNVNKIIGKLK